MQVKAYGTNAADDALAPMTIERRGPGKGNVRIKIDYCGVCHSDIQFAHNDWGNAIYPAVPGHEIVGHVIACRDRECMG